MLDFVACNLEVVVDIAGILEYIVDILALDELEVMTMAGLACSRHLCSGVVLSSEMRSHDAVLDFAEDE